MEKFILKLITFPKGTASHGEESIGTIECNPEDDQGEFFKGTVYGPQGEASLVVLEYNDENDDGKETLDIKKTCQGLMEVAKFSLSKTDEKIPYYHGSYTSTNGCREESGLAKGFFLRLSKNFSQPPES